jgi:hypothetical protein
MTRTKVANGRWTDRQADRQTDRQAGRQADNPNVKKTEGEQARVQAFRNPCHYSADCGSKLQMRVVKITRFLSLLVRGNYFLSPLQIVTSSVYFRPKFFFLML